MILALSGFVGAFLVSMLDSSVVHAIVFFRAYLVSLFFLFIFLVSWGVGSGPSLAVGSSKRKRDASHGRRMGKVKRDILVYSAVIKGSASGLPLVNL